MMQNKRAYTRTCSMTNAAPGCLKTGNAGVFQQLANTHNFVLVRVGEVGYLGLGLQIGSRIGRFVSSRITRGSERARTPCRGWRN